MNSALKFGIFFKRLETFSKKIYLKTHILIFVTLRTSELIDFLSLQKTNYCMKNSKKELYRALEKSIQEKQRH
jgi:hypothetical protein